MQEAGSTGRMDRMKVLRLDGSGLDGGILRSCGDPAKEALNSQFAYTGMMQSGLGYFGSYSESGILELLSGHL